MLQGLRGSAGTFAHALALFAVLLNAAALVGHIGRAQAGDGVLCRPAALGATPASLPAVPDAGGSGSVCPVCAGQVATAFAAPDTLAVPTPRCITTAAPFSYRASEARDEACVTPNNRGPPDLG